MEIAGALDLSKLPYASRQLMVVADDTVVQAGRQAEADAREKGSPLDYSAIAAAAIRIIAGGLPLVAFDAARLVIDGWARARRDGLSLLQVSISEANRVMFPPGHPREGVLYVGHPANPAVYYPLSEFHRATFEHKFAEAVILLTSLGATTIRVECVQGRTLDASLQVVLPPAETAAQAGVTRKDGRQATYEAVLHGVEHPSIPKDLVWFPYESTWQMIARSRLEAGLKNFSLEVRYEDDFGVHAGLKSQALKAGLEVGGRFQDHEATVWRITGTFKDSP